MTEAEWLACSDPEVMFGFLGNRASARKSRLFAVACCRQIWHLIKNEDSREAVEISEQYADGLASAKLLRGVAREAADVASELAWEAPLMMRTAKWAERDAAHAAAHAARGRLNLHWVVMAVRSAMSFSPDKAKGQDSLVRDLFGNPFRPVNVDLAWLGWNGSTIPRLAQAIYDERRFGDLPILADALEEAGCDNADVLAHCRSGGEHVRGCWVVDALLGKS
jgi:hypothetical protein